MADPQDRLDKTPDTAPQDAPGAGPRPTTQSAPPPDKAPATLPAEKAPPDTTAEKSPTPALAPHKAAKKSVAKKASAKATKKAQQASAKAAKRSQQTEPKKASARKAAAKKAPAKKAGPAAKPNSQAPTPPRVGTNGQLAAAAKDAAAHAKSTVDKASNPVSRDTVLPSTTRSPVPILVAVVVSLLALVLVRQLRRRGS